MIRENLEGRATHSRSECIRGVEPLKHLGIIHNGSFGRIQRRGLRVH